MNSETSMERVKETFEDWSLFDAVIQNDYMYHRQLADSLGRVAKQVVGDLRIIDLGCGDAWLPVHAFGEAKVAEYIGVDLSSGAVERAKRAVATLTPHAVVMCGDIVETLSRLPAGGASLILASNSLHHFTAEQKPALVRECFRVLAPGGIFCWVDPVRREGESRDGYLTRLAHTIEHEWTALSAEQKRQAIDHIWNCDYPELASWTTRTAQEVGFKVGERFMDNDFFGGWELVRR
jgi:SAM-dependent methyltransferase